VKNFLSWYISLAPEGETALIVKQKPLSPLQFHADGAIKATWPAYLPEKAGKKGALYGNTASFIIDRFKDGRVSASKENAEFVLVLVLDDVGTKSLVPPLEPTWKMETSPGNSQWGYAFQLDAQPSVGEFSAAIKAIASAGFTDRGAVNAVRNFRLPGSVNLKPGRGEFVSHLLEFEPSREYTLAAICSALGVVPGPTESTRTHITLTDNGNDDVLAWLGGSKLVLEQDNGSGWYGIQCPDADKHSDGNPMARYNPSTRSFCCYHSSCAETNSDAFLLWVEEEGGPSHQPGLRDDLLATVMRGVYEKIAPSAMFRDDAAVVIAAVERRELGRLGMDDLFSRFAYNLADNAYFDMDHRQDVARPVFDSIYRGLDTRSRHGKGQRVVASVYYDENREDKDSKVIHSLTYAAGEGVLLTRDGLLYGNKSAWARTHCSRL